jgi:hypothetical protein
MDGKCSNHLGLTAGLDPKVIRKPGIDDLLYDLAELVHLDGEDAAVLILVTALRYRLCKGLVETTDTVSEQIMATHQQGKAESALLGLVDQFHEINLLTITSAGMNRGMARAIDPYISLGPSLHIVESGVLLGDGS